MYLIHSPDGTNVYGARGGEFEGYDRSRGRGVESCKIVLI